jgi:hypothetical protein
LRRTNYDLAIGFNLHISEKIGITFFAILIAPMLLCALEPKKEIATYHHAISLAEALSDAILLRIFLLAIEADPIP